MYSDTVHRHWKSLLYFQNAVHFYGTCGNVISFMPPIIVLLFLPPMSMKPTDSQQCHVWTTYTEFHPNQKINVESTEQYSFTHLNKLRIYPCQFSWNSHTFNKYLWTSSLPNLVQIEYKLWRVNQNIFMLLSKEWLPLHLFAQNSQLLNDIT